MKMWETPKYYLGKEWDGHFELIGRHRDSNLLDVSNWFSAIEMLKAKGFQEEKDYFIARASHFLVGWVETIMIPQDSPAVALGEEIEERLETYPILNEDDFSQRELEQELEDAAEAEKERIWQEELAREEMLAAMTLEEREKFLEAEALAEQEAKDKAEMEKFSHLQIHLFD
jgi:hypothetical protein